MTVQPRRTPARRRAGAAVLALATVAGGWAVTTDRAAAATTTVNAKDFAFTPADVTISVGDTVRWVNGDAENHDLQGTSFASGDLPAGGTYSHTFTAPEEVSYFCKIHTYMTGTVKVQAAGKPAPAPAPAPRPTPARPTATTAPVVAAPTTTAPPTTTTTTRPPTAFQEVPDDPAGRKPPKGDGRSHNPSIPSASSGSGTSAPTTSTTSAPRGNEAQEVPDDPAARSGPGERDVVARSTSQAVVDEEHGPSPPAGIVHTDGLGDGTQLAPFTVVDGAKEFHLTMAETQVEVSPGVTKPAYAFNGQVPGPVIRVDEGDRVRIVVDNQLPFPTSTHWHGMILPNDQDGVGGITQPHIEPGTTYTYEWTAVATGTHWYHAHSSGRHIGKGLYGALEVVPEEGDLVADHDYRLMLGDTDLGFTINGRSFPSTPVLETEVGDTVRLRVINTGDQVHAFHLHGVPFRVMAQDGIAKRSVESMDTLTISPGQTFDLLFVQQHAGDWMVHCHMFVHSHMTGDTHPPGESGMNGMSAIVRASERTGPPTTAIDASEVSAGGDDDGSPVMPIVAAVLVVLTFGLLLRRTRQRTPLTPTAL